MGVWAVCFMYVLYPSPAPFFRLVSRLTISVTSTPRMPGTRTQSTTTINTVRSLPSLALSTPARLLATIENTTITVPM